MHDFQAPPVSRKPQSLGDIRTLWAEMGSGPRHQDFKSCPIPLTALPDPVPSVENRTFSRSAGRPTTASRRMTTGDSVRVLSESPCWLRGPAITDIERSEVRGRSPPVIAGDCNGGVPIRVEIRSGSSGPPPGRYLSRRTTIVDLSFRLVNAHSRIARAWSKYM